MKDRINTPQHYHLVSGLVLFETPEGLGQLPVNTILRNPVKTVPTRQIGRAQQAIQMIFHERMEDGGQLQVKDVHITAISYLGLMTEKEFSAPPEGTTLQEITNRKPN